MTDVEFLLNRIVFPFEVAYLLLVMRFPCSLNIVHNWIQKQIHLNSFHYCEPSHLIKASAFYEYTFEKRCEIICPLNSSRNFKYIADGMFVFSEWLGKRANRKHNFWIKQSYAYISTDGQFRYEYNFSLSIIQNVSTRKGKMMICI